MSSLVSTTVTSLAGSRDRWYAAVRPTWPAPRIRIFISACAPSLLHQFKIRILQHQPFGTLLLEIHLHARVRSLAFHRQHHALAEFAMSHARTQAHAITDRFRQRTCAPATASFRQRAAHGRMRHADAWPDFRDHRRRDLLNESRGRIVAVHTVQPALLGISGIQLLHGS